MKELRWDTRRRWKDVRSLPRLYQNWGLRSGSRQTSKSNGLNGISCLTRAAKCQTKGQHQLHVNHQNTDWPDCDQAEKSYHKPRGRKYISTTKKPISMYPNRIVGVDYPSQWWTEFSQLNCNRVQLEMLDARGILWDDPWWFEGMPVNVANHDSGVYVDSSTSAHLTIGTKWQSRHTSQFWGLA